MGIISFPPSSQGSHGIGQPRLRLNGLCDRRLAHKAVHTKHPYKTCIVIGQ